MGAAGEGAGAGAGAGYEAKERSGRIGMFRCRAGNGGGSGREGALPHRALAIHEEVPVKGSMGRCGGWGRSRQMEWRQGCRAAARMRLDTEQHWTATVSPLHQLPLVRPVDPQAMQLLLAIGANVLDIDTYGNTAVHYAAFKGHTKVRCGAATIQATGFGVLQSGGPRTQFCAVVRLMETVAVDQTGSR